MVSISKNEIRKIWFINLIGAVINIFLLIKIDLLLKIRIPYLVIYIIAVITSLFYMWRFEKY